jgi:DNA-directed RNA polymerase specialized sigma24 family protein
MALGKTVWTLTPEAFERLLASFDSDRERAGQKYENTRRKLLEFFEARGSRAPDEHADETLNRVARKIVEGEAIENLNNYCYGVARFLWLEASRGRAKEPLRSTTITPPQMKKTANNCGRTASGGSNVLKNVWVNYRTKRAHSSSNTTAKKMV